MDKEIQISPKIALTLQDIYYLSKMTWIVYISKISESNVSSWKKLTLVGVQGDRERCEEGSESDSIESIYKKLSTPKVSSNLDIKPPK